MGNRLFELSVGDAGRVSGYVKGLKGYRQKLMTMGLVKDTPFRVTRVAPMGDPIEIEVRDYSLSLRKNEARALIVEGI